MGAEFGLKAAMEQVLKVAPQPSPVVLYGETGTGKELMANAIHNFSPRHSGPLIKVNCGAIPRLTDRQRAFRPRKRRLHGGLIPAAGRFERAHGGTEPLHEVSEFSLNAQVRLLRVLQEKEIERVGGVQSVKVDIRIISATNKDLRTLVARNLFRDDLYYRLSVFPIHIPPLRERRMDIPALVEFFMRKKSREVGFNFVPGLAPGTMEKLIGYSWPGNVRELSNAVERAIIIHEGKPLTYEDIVGLQGGHDREAEKTSEEDGMTLTGIEALHIRRALEAAEGRVEGPAGRRPYWASTPEPFATGCESWASPSAGPQRWEQSHEKSLKRATKSSWMRSEGWSSVLASSAGPIRKNDTVAL